MSNKPSLEQYLRSKMTWFDYVCIYSWVLFVIMFLTYFIVLALGYSVDGRKAGLSFFVPILIVIVLRDFVYARKERKRKEEWENL